MEILLIRHGENKANITKEFSYKLVDYPLTEKGTVQAIQTANYLKNLKIDKIISSPLKRAMETAAYISKSINLEFEIAEELREINVGYLEKEALTKDSWKEYFQIIAEWNNGNIDKKFPGGESGRELRTRFVNLIHKIVKNPYERIILVGHVGIFINGVIELCQIYDQIDSLTQNHHNCSISRIFLDTYDTNKKFTLLSWGNTSHLNGEALNFQNWKKEEG